MKILIVYQEIPESVQVFSEEVKPEEWKWMWLTHMNLNNTVLPKKIQKAYDQLSVWLEDKKPISCEDPFLLRGESYDYCLLTGWVM